MPHFDRILLCIPLLLAGCASEPPKPAAEKPKEPAQRPEPVSSQYAFRQMYLAARSWA